MNNLHNPLNNRTVHQSVSVFGAVIAISGLLHGYFEFLQGDRSTASFVIQSLGPENQNWLNGEEAFTLLNTFRATGIAAIITSLFIITWSIGFIHRKSGPAIYLLLNTFLALTGGGISFILFFIPVMIYSTRIRKELSWRKNASPGKTMEFLSNSWASFLILTCILFLSATLISFFGIRQLGDETISLLVYSQYLAGILTLNLTFFGALGKDIRSDPGSPAFYLS